MKRVTVRFFAALRDQAGREQLSCETDSDSLQDLFRELSRQNPGLSESALSLVAVNDEMRPLASGFEDGDTVLFFPPVAGG